MALWRAASYSARSSPDLRPYTLRTDASICGRGPGKTTRSCQGGRRAPERGAPDCRLRSRLAMSRPGPLVARWGTGNWSGSENEKLRTMRAGAGLQELDGGRFLIYAFFWSATPSAMARVFQAYQCSYAMLLDMNALVHTYLAVYGRQEGTHLRPAPHPRHERGRRVRERTVYTALPRFFG